MLALTAHGGDLELFAGGTIAKLGLRGAEVHLVIATDNSKATFELTTDEMLALRLEEAGAAARVLGLRSVACLDYPDGELSDVPLNELRRHFIEAIRRHRPDIVFAFDPHGSPFEHHQDHRAVALAALEACNFAHFPLYEPQQLADGLEPWLVPEIYCFGGNAEGANRTVDIAGEPLDRKIAALLRFESQMVRALEEAQAFISVAPFDIAAVTRLDPHDYQGFVEERVRRRAEAAGALGGFAYGERFLRRRWGGYEELADSHELRDDDW